SAKSDLLKATCHGPVAMDCPPLADTERTSLRCAIMAETKFSCPVVVISMTNARDRRTAFSARAQSAQVPWRFFDARTDLTEGLVLDAKAVERNKGRPLTSGEIGCYVSHFSIWQEMVERGIAQCIVLEDDTIVDWAFLAQLAATDLAARDLPYLRLYSKRPTYSRVVAKDFLQRSRTIVELVGYPFGTQAYAITLGGAQAFLRACATIKRPIDDQMDRSWEHGVRNLALFPAPVIEEFVESGIGSARYGTQRSEVFHAPSQRLARWVDRQRIRMKKLGVPRGG
ncbi:MAG TPA: glycosyltransferase family 25 protein, partial [Candidatus Polarisedimenticolia bacterium]|nr:glycosyltransferase family 25 protein [Candidatus Polarisedimenticolia bacterium]